MVAGWIVFICQRPGYDMDCFRSSVIHDRNPYPKSTPQSRKRPGGANKNKPVGNDLTESPINPLFHALCFWVEEIHNNLAQFFFAIGDVGENAGGDFLINQVARIKAHACIPADDSK